MPSGYEKRLLAKGTNWAAAVDARTARTRCWGAIVAVMTVTTVVILIVREGRWRQSSVRCEQ